MNPQQKKSGARMRKTAMQQRVETFTVDCIPSSTQLCSRLVKKLAAALAAEPCAVLKKKSQWLLGLDDTTTLKKNTRPRITHALAQTAGCKRLAWRSSRPHMQSLRHVGPIINITSQMPRSKIALQKSARIDVGVTGNNVHNGPRCRVRYPHGGSVNTGTR